MSTMSQKILFSYKLNFFYFVPICFMFLFAYNSLFSPPTTTTTHTHTHTSKKRGHIALLISVGRNFCFRSITQECLNLPFPNLVLCSKGIILMLGSLGQMSRSPGWGKSCQISFRWITREHIGIPSANIVYTFVLGCKGQYHRGQMWQNRFRSITREHLDLPSSNLVYTSIMSSRTNTIYVEVTGSTVKFNGIKCAKTVSDQ